MGFKMKLAAAAGVTALGMLAVAAGVWYFVIRSDPPPPVSLSSALKSVSLDTALESVGIPATEGGDAMGSSSDDSGRPDETAMEDGFTGTWVVVQGDGSFAGYRVNETLARFGANTAVGRTSDVEGSFEFDGKAISNAEVTVDLRTLRSDQAVRDEQLQTQALETDVYPTATFVLTSPIAIESVPAEGERVKRTVAGELTLHGVTHGIEVDVEGALQNGRLVVVGSTDIQFSDFNIEQPVSFSVLSIENHGTMELQLLFSKAAGPS